MLLLVLWGAESDWTPRLVPLLVLCERIRAGISWSIANGVNFIALAEGKHAPMDLSNTTAVRKK